MYICLSKRPGLIRAGSRMSGLLVPASTTTLIAVLNPTRQVKLDDKEPFKIIHHLSFAELLRNC